MPLSRYASQRKNIQLNWVSTVAGEITIVNRTKSNGDELAQFSNKLGLNATSQTIEDMNSFDSDFDKS